jgi:hypothetical protein
LSGHIASPNLQPSAIVGATVPLPMPKSPENLRLQVGREIIVQGNHWGGLRWKDARLSLFYCARGELWQPMDTCVCI